MGVPFYRTVSGLQFECTGCGACCTRPGPVYLPPEDLARAAAFLNLTPAAFRRRYNVHRVDGVPAIDPGDRDACPFHDEETGCTIYEARPTQCRTFPFWPEVVRRRGSWERAGRDCEGIGRGPLHEPAEIERAILLCEEVGLPEGDPW